MSAANFKTENNTYRKLISGGLSYRIPHFQPDYNWTENEWGDLWADIMGVIQADGEPVHYMGYLVLQSKDNRTFDVIEGQQRLTTLMLIILAALKNLTQLIAEKSNPEVNQQRMNQIRQTYIAYLDPVTLVSQTKLTLNRNNDIYFQNYLIPLDYLLQRGCKESERRLCKALEWFAIKMNEYTKNSGGDEGITLASLVELISDRLFFTVISVTDELNAYKVFEMLNARGIRLSSVDLLKNHLLSVLYGDKDYLHEMKTLEDRWEAMVICLGGESFPDFLLVHWISRHAFVRQSELFKTMRSKVTGREEVFKLLQSMEEDIKTYLALTQVESSQWPVDLKESIQDLHMLRVRQPFPLLLAAHRMLSASDFERVLRNCIAIAFRYIVIGSQPTNKQESMYYLVAQKISRGDMSTATAVLEAMQFIYPSDDEFRSAFSDKKISATTSRCVGWKNRYQEMITILKVLALT
ncbi:MAG: DUF262 domain-containing protein [Candidatus Nitrotoga sp.]|nr:DUF262 domain-containing protein [Candidatus Nitrotoga sp.]MDO9447422.1 DUF262 domain-containing protein [Candidatus Nitrotoga sp.]MDP3498366.1 DUF262 domain-containing protein [Candidatus Nitrotoga sp.]